MNTVDYGQFKLLLMDALSLTYHVLPLFEMESFYVANIPDIDSSMTVSFLQHRRMSCGHFPLNTVDLKWKILKIDN